MTFNQRVVSSNLARDTIYLCLSGGIGRRTGLRAKKALSTSVGNTLSEFAQIRGNLPDNADGNPEPRFAEVVVGIFKL